MSITNEFVRYAKINGYTVDLTGKIFNHRGKPVKGSIKRKKDNRKGKGSGEYLTHMFTVTDPKDGYKSRPIPTHRFVAYLKYGEEAFLAECVRHLNDNSLDNSWDNIAIGSHVDNHLDAVRNGKAENNSIQLSPK